MSILGSAAGSRKKERRKKPEELLSSVVRETAIPAAVELLRSNTKFVFPSGTAWVMLVLAADAIGGLSKRHGRDEAKGSIIELIASDQIHTVATAEMLAEEVFGIIPDDETLARMQEYSLLTGADYGWAVVWQKSSGDLLVDLVGEATFTQALEVFTGTASLKEIVGEQAWSEHSGVVEVDGNSEAESETIGASDSETPTEPVETVQDDGDPIFDEPAEDDGPAEDNGDEPVFDDVVDVDEDADAPVFDEDATDNDAPDESEPLAEPENGDSVFEEFDDQSESYGDAEDWTQDEQVQLEDQTQVREVIARRFLSEDLNLDIGLEEFNTSFGIGAPIVQIDVPEGATEWLGDQVAQLNRQANADLAQLRSAHEDELRVFYVNLMSSHVEQVIRDVATDREGSRYKQLKDEAEADYQRDLANKEKRVREAKAAIIEEFEVQAKKLAEQAALNAELQFKERNRARIEREQGEAAATVDREIEDERTRAQQNILRVRRNHATLKMQVGTSRIFEILAERQSEYLAAEEERLGQWKDEIQRIVDDNRKADIAQAEALAQHHATTDEIGILRREQESLLESIRAEHAERIRRAEEELDRSRQDAITAAKLRDEEWQHALNLEKQQTDLQSSRVTELLKQIETAEETVSRRYEARLIEMATDKEAFQNELARASEVQGRSNKILIVLLVAIGMLAGLAGFIFGVGITG